MIASSKRVSKILKDLHAATPDIEASAVVSPEGIMIASELPSDIEEAKMSSVTTAMAFLGEKSTRNLTGGGLKQMYVRGEYGYILLRTVGKRAVLIGKVQENAKLRSVFANLKETEEKLAKITQGELSELPAENFSKKESKNLDREALLKKYRIKMPSEKTILKILENSGVDYRDRNSRKDKQSL
ncbi:MAG: roadblock/LC7 domain-containing protein [Euryarchaeota archaeon]|nr:roadblock/LC7 domain-containing protein [Euryarchaeota archaeon]